MSRSPLPALPGGYKLGEKVFFTGTSFTYENYKWVHGQQGEVVGPATSEGYKGKGVAVLFPGNIVSLSCFLRHVRAAFAATHRLSNACPSRSNPPHSASPAARVVACRVAMPSLTSRCLW